MIKLRTCNKIKYPTQKLALMALDRIRHKKKSNHNEKRIYQCPICAHWHLTSMTKE